MDTPVYSSVQERVNVQRETWVRSGRINTGWYFKNVIHDMIVLGLINSEFSKNEVIGMNLEKGMTCRICGSTTFTSGKVSNSHAKLMPLDKAFFSTGSSLIFTFCKDCGEVSSIKVKDPSKF
jgi:hypothetical protein